LIDRGGHIFLGVTDDKEICGIDENSIEAIVKDFTTTINNPQKIFPPLYLTMEIIEIEEGKRIIYIRVPEGGQVRRHGGKIWDRSNEGDINITNNEELVYKLYARKQGTYFVNKVYPKLNWNLLDLNLISRARKMAVARIGDHPWRLMDDEEILRSSGLILNNLNTLEEGFTLATILLFGKDSTIMSALSQYKTDAIYRVINVDRYNDRDVIITNLLDSHDRLMAFGRKHLNDIFVLDGIQSVSARDRILREIVSNTLSHRDYASGFPAKFIIERNQVYIENGNMPHGHGELLLDKFEPYPKNPAISKVFREIGLADELGPGMRNTNKYTALYSGGKPLFEEGNVFKTIIPLSDNATIKVGPEDNVGHYVSHNVGHQNIKYGSLQELIMELVLSDSKITKKRIADIASVSEKTIEREMKKMPEIEYVGSGAYGQWVVKEK